MIAIYPGSTGNLTAVYIAETTTLNSSDDAFNLPDQDMDLVYDMCEIVLLTHLRLYPEVERKIEHFRKTIAPHVGGQ